VTEPESAVPFAFDWAAPVSSLRESELCGWLAFLLEPLPALVARFPPLPKCPPREGFSPCDARPRSLSEPAAPSVEYLWPPLEDSYPPRLPPLPERPPLVAFGDTPV
jgi:hypothetical protein